MATKVIVCPECESPLLSGRFSCQGCGMVVAAVASDARSFARAEPTVPPVVEPAAADLPEESEPLALWSQDDAFDAAQLGGPPVDDPELARPEPDPTVARAASAVRPVDAVAAPQWPTPGASIAAQASASGVPSWPAQPAWPAQPSWPPVHDRPAAPEPALEPAARTPAGAYLPPSAVLPSGEALPAAGSGAGRQASSRGRTLAERFALGEEDGPWGLPATLPGRAIALGAAIAGLGFLLPWAEVVIGSTGFGGFLDQWGLAGPGHWLMLLLLVAVGGLAVAGERTSVRIGTSTVAIVLGALLAGLAFPYVMGPFREAVGVYVTLCGALMMIAGGLLARVAPRHDLVAESV